MSHYEPIDCGLHDIIEDRIVRRVTCRVLYRAEDDETKCFSGKLVDVFSRDGAEYVTFDRGDVVRLDRVLKVDEQAFH